MIYIAVPKWMSFAKLDTRVEKDGVDDIEAHDCFVSEDENIKPISIQASVKQFLATHKNKGVVNGLEIFKNRPMTSALILAYCPNRNGCDPSNKVELLNQRSNNEQPRLYGGQSYGNLPFLKTTPLSVERKEELEKKRDAERDNRRHYGDSPKAT